MEVWRFFVEQGLGARKPRAGRSGVGGEEDGERERE